MEQWMCVIVSCCLVFSAMRISCSIGLYVIVSHVMRQARYVLSRGLNASSESVSTHHDHDDDGFFLCFRYLYNQIKMILEFQVLAMAAQTIAQS